MHPWDNDRLIGDGIEVLYTEDMEALLVRHPEIGEIQYVEGWDKSFLNADWSKKITKPIIVSSEILKQLNISPGDTFYITDSGYMPDMFHIKERPNVKMTIFTSHRLSNVSLADRIVVLENGRVMEDGTQDELLKKRARYAELFRYQQEKYLPKEKQNADCTD